MQRLLWGSFLLAGTALGTSNNEADSVASCRARSWVRAPDMMPGTVLKGDVNIMLDGDCAEVKNYSLGLRLKERIFFKIPREGAAIPARPKSGVSQGLRGQLDQGIFSPAPDWGVWGLARSKDTDSSAWETYEEAVRNEDIWFVHEEEAVTFEIRFPLETPHDVSQSSAVVSEFGLLVPDTNYPPAMDHAKSGTHLGGDEIVQAESVYEYFTEIHFANGTLKEISAGITAFQPLYPPVAERKSTVMLQLESDRHIPAGTPDPLQSNYTAEITVPVGLSFLQGSKQNLSVVLHRLGYSNRTDSPTHVSVHHQFRALPHWSSLVFDPGNRTYRTTYTNRVLSTTLDFEPIVRNYQCLKDDTPSIVFQKPTQVDSDQHNEAGHPATMTSEPITLPFHVGRESIPDFAARYQKLSSELWTHLTVPRAPEEPLYPTDPFSEVPVGKVDDEQYDWVPWAKPDNLRRRLRMLRGCVDISVVLETPSAVAVTPPHYLSADARTPTFVDHSTIPDLLAETREERNLRAPLASHQIKVIPKGEEVILRYFSGHQWRYPIYVGETWVKKVLPRLERNLEGKDTRGSAFVVQGE
ncbi:hypothetical protein BV22DRAFT_1129798 [Leucogyrophana mollusca]|uniref:Uncharacterized protein n=1 Tax=Leucogyrophana mollusca TaxID=85980 RepID=A0ACB8BGS4_9AGAM|nr:hypothetical protein BV22DRAFT_1129798 [Leucogyrophana mollusca]